MFTFRRKPKKPEVAPIRTSPSLPDLKDTVQEVIPWPEDLVDVNAIHNHEDENDDEYKGVDGTSTTAHTEEGVRRPKQGATPISLKAGGTPIMFHKPFHRYTDSSPKTNVSTSGEASVVQENGDTAPISQFYMALATPVEALEELRKKKVERRVKSGGASSGRISQRRAKVPPTFNIMVVGGKGTGKSSLLRLLLQTAEISPAASEDQRVALDKFLKDSGKSTQALQATSVEICESKFDRILLSVTDTPGLDFQQGRELKLERQVNTVLRYVDAQYADTMNEESKVVRQQKGDQHIHLCIYMIDPTSMITAEARRASTPHYRPAKTRSDTTISQIQPPELVPDTSSGDDTEDEAEDEENEKPLTMSPAELKVIRRIANRSNVLPVIAHADSLTDERLQAVKEAVRRDLAGSGIDFGVFGPAMGTSEGIKTPKKTKFADRAEDGVDTIEEEQEQDEEDDERQSRPLIKLRPSRHQTLSRSRSRRRAHERDERRPISPDENDLDSVANVRFSAHIIAKNDISSLLPFALITPEYKKQQRHQEPSVIDSPASISQQTSVSSNNNQSSSTTENVQSLTSPGSLHSIAASAKHAHPPFLPGPPADLKGVFTRKFRWGTVDVLDPNHCDFAALRTAILSTHLKILKLQTREVLYEKYRTEKLLARRATQQISEEERQRLLEGTYEVST